MIVTRNSLEGTIHFAPAQRLVYLNNAKVACSSVKKALWMGFDPGSFDQKKGPHDRNYAPFSRTLEDITERLNEFQSAKIFTVVRNPYTRILSAYLDKVSASADGQEKKRDAAVWHPFCRRYRLPATATPTFGEFLKMVTSEEPSLLDQHFAPQHINILHAFVSCDFIGHMEQMSDVWLFLSGFGVPEAAHRPHNTKANSSIGEFYNPDEIDLVRSFYAKDFELFGYSENPTQLKPVRNITRNLKSRELIKNLVHSFTAPHIHGRQRCIEATAKAVPEMLDDFNSLENGSVQMNELVKLSQRAIRGDIQNWKLVVRIGQELLKNDMIYEAASVVHRARVIMYGRG